MSAISQSIRFKFIDYFRQLFQKSARTAPDTVAANPPAPGPPPNGHAVALPLTAVLGAFPLELRSKILPDEIGDLMLPVPFEKVMRELTRGAVTMTFGEIRGIAPEAFAPGSESDATPVVLPLNEILSRLDPALLLRRPTQRKPLALPEEISSPFAGRGQGLTFGVVNPRPAPAGVSATEPIVARTPGSPMIPAAPFPVAAPIPLKLPDADERPMFARKPAGVTPNATTTSPGQPPLRTPPPAGPSPAKDFLAAPPVARAMQPVSSTKVATSSTDAAVLLAPLTAFLATWPDALREEIVQLNLIGAPLALPVELIEASLKRGRVTFPWKTLRSWIYPAPPPGDSAHGATELELPLNVVTPLFFASQHGAGKSQRVNVDETIPDLFFGLPKPESAATSRTPDTNFYTWGDHTDTPRMEDAEYNPLKRPGTDSVAKPITPNEIVSRAAALEGVAGVVMALPDGLLVSSRISPEFNGDTLAAFLPQIFAKVSQSTKELRLGDLNNLSFTVGNVPWKIFRVNALFFAAFGHTDGQLPTGELARLAAELDRRR